MAKNARWLVLAAVLLGLGAWLMAGKAKPPPKAIARPFPVAPKMAEVERMQARRTWSPPPIVASASSSAAAPAPPAAPRDPLLLAFAAPADMALMVEARALLDTPVAGMLLDCMSNGEKEEMEKSMREQGIDWRKAIERAGVFKEQGKGGEMLALQGNFAGADWKKIAPGAEERTVGDQGRILVRSGGEATGIWRDQMVLVGESSSVERAMKRLSGELPPGPSPISENEAYGEIYGMLGAEALAKLAPPEMRSKVEVLSRVELHVDALDDILLVMDGSGRPDEHGHSSHEIVELAKTMAAAVSVARVKARADKDDVLVDLLDQSRVRPFQGGIRAELAVPLETVKKHLAGCKKHPELSGTSG